MPRYPANRRESAWIGSGDFRSIPRAKGRAEKQVPEAPQQKRDAPERSIKGDRESSEKKMADKREVIPRGRLAPNQRQRTNGFRTWQLNSRRIAAAHDPTNCERS